MSSSAAGGLDLQEMAVLAGGLATRLLPVTERIPKAMVEVAGRRFVDHQLDLLVRRGIRRVVLCVGHLGEQIERHVGDGRRHGLEVRYSHDGGRLLGTGGALRRAALLLGPVFWVTYGDAYLDVDYAPVLGAFRRAAPEALLVVYRNASRWDHSNAVFQEGRLVRYDKQRPTLDMEHIDYGLAILTRPILERLPSDRPADLGDLYRDLVAEGRMIGVEVSQRFHEIGSPAGLAETDAYLRRTCPTPSNI